MGTVLCKLFRYILCNIFVAYERDSKYCVSFRFVSFRFVSFRFVSFRFVSFRFVSFRFVSFRFVSFRFVSIMYASHSNFQRLKAFNDITQISSSANGGRGLFNLI